MDVGGYPERVADALPLQRREKIGDLQLTAKRRSIVALRHRFAAEFAIAVIGDVKADGHIGGNHLPGRRGGLEGTLEPGDLLRTKEIAVGSIGVLPIFAVRSPVAAHIEHEDVDERTIGDAAIDAAWLGSAGAQRHVVMKSAGAARR